MKKYAYLLLFTAYFLTACQKGFLEKGPLDRFTDETVWKDSALVNLYVANIYSGIISEYDRAGDALSMSYTDEGEANRPYLDCQLVNFAQYNAATGVFSSSWTDNYTSIRKCNTLLEQLQSAPFSAALQQRMRGEAFFLRALFYMDIYQHFGAFPIIDKALGLNDELAVPRATNKACVDFILKDLEAAAAILPAKYTDLAQTGRATKGACYAMKCRLLLNELDYQGAAAAAKQVMDLNQYKLFPDFKSMFQPANDNNVEVIFDKQFGSLQSKQKHDLNSYEYPRNFTGFASGVNDPTQNIVDAFLMKDGKPWDQSPLYNPDHPYDNRDPRLYASVLYDGIMFRGEILDLRLGSAANPTDRGTPTGYYLKKFLDTTYDLKGLSVPNFNNCVIMRMGEVYLNYAECQLKLGNPEEARTYVNLIRARAGMPEILPGEMTWDKYERERTVELAFEGQRWADIRRWKKGPEIIGQPTYGMVISVVNGKRTYTRTKIEDRVFIAPMMYLFPIPQTVLNKYPAGKELVQNPDWK
ncbi:RagB/SusD family nutrient uptake outer membrane protein [Chitinophaga qingshengii]|uniref:RagB/SusD family nutrient uptake outer membrane protein n=1 Tax=Chitinophaga qingshengii TaxID=1569794 RepID=A0ABR7TS96_9BACT|nr:RagB/SusD family nutrient uptake outer membrane protein [Chitinophaga qingshengii]MBC9933332.1 RagB/SusD family nutrient uptake outer membrane protein [Chitinophaga qingshengii]